MAEHKEKKVRYLELYERIRTDIIEGRYRFGEKLPSKRLWAAENGVSVITAEHCYDLLLEEGYIEARERSGYYVCFQANFSFSLPEESSSGPWENSEGEKAEENWDKLARNEEFSQGESEGIPYTVLAKTIRRVLTEYGEKICERSPGNGIPALRTAIADYLRRSRGIQVLPEQILIGSGAEYLYSLVVQILGRERIYGLEKPSYEKIQRIYENMGAHCELLPMGADGIRSQALKKTRAGVLHVTPFNSFPTGITASASKRREYIHWAEAREAMLVEDDFDSEFSMSTKVEDTLFSLEPERSVLYMNSFTKTVAPSFRVAYLLLPKERLSQFRDRINFYSCTVPVLDQYVLAELIQSGDFERNINRVRRRRRQKFL